MFLSFQIKENKIKEAALQLFLHFLCIKKKKSHQLCIVPLTGADNAQNVPTVEKGKPCSTLVWANKEKEGDDLLLLHLHGTENFDFPKTNLSLWTKSKVHTLPQVAIHTKKQKKKKQILRCTGTFQMEEAK